MADFLGLTKDEWGGVGAASSATGSVLSGLTAYHSSKTQAKLLQSQAKAQAKVAERNLQTLHKSAGLQLRILEDQRVSAEADTRASIAACGIRQDSQTAQEVFRRNEAEIAQEKWNIRQQAIEQSVSMQLESRLNTISLNAQASATKAAGKAAFGSSIFNAVGGAASFLGK